MSRTSYDCGWDDGYAEGYACKLADATEPFSPISAIKPVQVEAVADWLMSKYKAVFADRSDAIGMARGRLKAAASQPSSPTDGNGGGE